ncbi:hypothetical protein SAMN05720762_101416 [Fibrobacter sp. UWH4]|nr:hypothetical protein SAMN05720762_101416 [Fibrobacter sp. UWH4]
MPLEWSDPSQNELENRFFLKKKHFFIKHGV